MPLKTVAQLDRRAAQAGRKRSVYIRDLIDEDLRAGPQRRKHVFASDDLVGCVDSGIKSSRKTALRKIIRERVRAHYEKNRRHRAA